MFLRFALHRNSLQCLRIILQRDPPETKLRNKEITIKGGPELGTGSVGTEHDEGKQESSDPGQSVN